MRPFLRPLAALALATPLLAAAASGDDAPGTASPGPAVLSRAPVDLTEAALAAHLQGTVRLRVHVSKLGLADSVIALGGDPRLREGAVASARWTLFAPPSAPVWTSLEVEVDARDAADPLTPDVLAIARDAERRGAPWEAIDACSGALQRIGTNPRLRNEWPIRDRAIRLARHVPAERLRVPGAFMTECQGARERQFRTMSRADNEDFVTTFDQALLICPWWADGYQWRAASLLRCGRGMDAMRTLVLFRSAAGDSTARSIADRALATLAGGDSLATAQLLIREGLQFNLDEDADH
jgi:hypothetical protein